MRSKGRLALITTLAAALALVGCGREEGDDNGAAETAAPVEEGAASGSLTMWAMGTEGELLPELLEQYLADNPDLNVTVTPVPWDSAHDKFTSAIAAGTTPDLAMVGSTWMGEFVGLDALDPVPDLIDGSKFFDGAQATNVIDDVAYGVPWYVETRLLFYRTDMAEQAGISEPPGTWEELTVMAAAMKDVDGARWGINLQPGATGSWQTVIPFMWSNGGEIVNEDGTEFTFDSEQNVEALAYYQSFFTEELANTAPVEGTTESDFVSGAVPMFISGPWMMASVEAAGGEGFADKYDVAVMPTKEISASFVGGSNLAVFKNTQNRDAAWNLVNHLTQEATQVEWFEISTDLPSVEAAWDDPALADNEKLAKFGEQLQTAFAPPPITTWEQVASVFDAQVERVAKQGADPGEALAQVQQEATSIGMG